MPLMARKYSSRRRRTIGQASVELLVGLPLLLLAAVVVVQLLMVGQGRLQADAAAEAAALALAVGGDPDVAARNALPVSVRNAVRVRTEDGVAEVQVPVLSPLALIGVRVRLTSVAFARLPDDDHGVGW